MNCDVNPLVYRKIKKCKVTVGLLVIGLLAHGADPLLEKPPIVQPLKNFPVFYGSPRFITVFIRALHWSIC
jgi:hypothetical protein